MQKSPQICNQSEQALRYHCNKYQMIYELMTAFKVSSWRIYISTEYLHYSQLLLVFKLLIPLKNLTLIIRVFKIKNEMEDDQMIDCSVVYALAVIFRLINDHKLEWTTNWSNLLIVFIWSACSEHRTSKYEQQRLNTWKSIMLLGIKHKYIQTG